MNVFSRSAAERENSWPLPTLPTKHFPGERFFLSSEPNKELDLEGDLPAPDQSEPRSIDFQVFLFEKSIIEVLYSHISRGISTGPSKCIRT
jgi:hypothetical protein